MQLIMSFVGGLMLGVALLHMLPHAAVETNSLDYACWACMFGLLAMFLVIRVFHVHQHHSTETPSTSEQDKPHANSSATCQLAHDHGEPCVHSHHLSWIGLFAGMAIHSLIDGVAVAASVVAYSGNDSTVQILGMGTFIAVLFHKPLDSLSVISVMVAGDWSKRAQSIVNGVFALICPAGALLFYFGTRELPGQQFAVGCALGFSAGVFLCISLADILPEIQFHRHDRVKLFAALLLGVSLSFIIGRFEPKHAHDMHGSSHSQELDSSDQTHGQEQDAHKDHSH